MIGIGKVGKDILDVSFAIHSRFGSGLLGKACRIILASEWRKLGHPAEEEKRRGFDFNGSRYENMFRVDLLVGNAVVDELESASRRGPGFAKRRLACMRLPDMKLGHVANFGMPSLRDVIERVVNDL